MAHTGLGIYIDGNLLAIAVVRNTYRNSILKDYQSFVLNNDDLTDETVIQEIVTTIQEFCAVHNIKPSRTNIGLSPGKYFWNLIDMPPVSRSDIYQILKYDLMSHIPFEPEAVNFDALPLFTPGSTNGQTLLITALKKNIQAALNVCSQTGLNADQIEPGSLSRWRIIKTLNKKSETKNNIVISFFENYVEIIILDSGYPVQTRIVKTTDPWTTVEEKTPSEQQKPSSLPVTAENIIADIKFSILSQGKSTTLEDYDEILIFGHVSDNISDSLSSLLHPKKIIHIHDMDLITAQMNSVEITAVGLALAGEDDEMESINLVPQDLRPVHRHMGMMLTGIMSGVFLSLMMLVGVNNYWSLELDLLKTTAQITSLDKRVNRIMEIKRQYKSAKDEYEFFRKRSWDYPSELQVLSELTTILPAEDAEEDDEQNKVWLQSYKRKELEVTIKGKSKSPEILITLMEDSPFFEKVDFEGTVSGDTFRIKAELSKWQYQEELTEEEEKDIPDESDKSVESTSPSDTPTPKQDKENEQDVEEFVEEEEFSRGPAFPRIRDQKTEGDERGDGEEVMGNDAGQGNNGHEEEAEQPADVDPEQVKETSDSEPEQDKENEDEEMEKMKENLFDFIKQHRDEGNIVDREREPYDDPDPDEAADNFLEFLKAAAEEGQPEDEQED